LGGGIAGWHLGPEQAGRSEEADHAEDAVHANKVTKEWQRVKGLGA
jgi:hypothetical protein